MKRDLYLDNYCKAIREKMKSTVLIYGAGHVGKNVLKICNSNGIHVDGFCVTNLQK